MTTRRKWLWWLLFFAILVAGFVLAATGYRHGLPAVDFGDEVTIWTMGRGYFDPSWTIYQPQYPPGILVVSAAVQQLQIALGDPYINVAVTVEVMRLMSVVAFVVTLALTMGLARRLAGPVAGIAAGLFLAPLPLATDLAKLSTNNLWTTMWLVAAVYAGIEAWSRRSMRWIAVSFVLAIIGTLFKWQDAATLGIAGMALLCLWPLRQRRTLIAVAIYVAIMAVLSYWVIYVHHALEGDVYMPGIPSKPPTPDLLMVNLITMTTEYAPVLIYALLPIVAILLSLLPRYRYQLHNRAGMWTLLPIILVYDIIISFNGAPVFSRQYLPIIPLFAALAGVGVALLFNLARSMLARPRWLYAAAVTLLVVVLAVPVGQMTAQTYQSDMQDLLPDRRAALIEWARTTIDGPVLTTDNELAPILQPTYGYRGPRLEQPYNLDGSVQVRPEAVDQKVLEAQNIRYLITSTGFKPGNLPLTLLLRYAPPKTRGNAWQAYYVGSLPVVLPDPPATFGNQLALRGYDISAISVCPGDTVNVRMLWSALTSPDLNYSTFIHLSNAQIGDFDFFDAPLGTQTRPTTTWHYPGEIVVDPTETITVRRDIKPATYELWLGVYEPLADKRLTLPDDSDHFVLGTLRVNDCTF